MFLSYKSLYILKVILIVSLIISQAVFADSVDYENKFIKLNLSISPNTDGFLDGNASIELNWMPFLQSGILFISNGFTQAINEGNDDYTTISSTKTLVLNALKINDELLWNIIGINFDFIDFYIGIIGKWVNTITKEYGYKESTPPAYFYIENSELNYIKPLFAFGLGIDILFINLNGYGEITPIPVTENTEGNFLYSIDSQKKNFSITDIGFDSRYGGNVILKLNIIDIGFNIDFYRHIGYSEKYFGGDFNRYVYETIDLSLSAYVALDFFKSIGTIPVIGFTYIQHSFNPSSTQYGLVQFTNERYRIDIGFKY